MFEFLDKYKYGILAALGSYVLLFVYLNVETLTSPVYYDVWDERAELQPEEIPLKPENIEFPAEMNRNPSDVKSIAKDANDTRELSNDNWDRNKAAKDVEAQIKKLEADEYKKSGGAEKQAEIKRELEKQRAELEQIKKEKQTKNQNQPVSGGDKAYKGSTMVYFSVSNHGPFQNNEWYVRNPGYTCGKAANGTVRIRIRVDQSGKVKSAVYEPKFSNGADECMIETALKYARMSRFDYNSKAGESEEGYIDYQYISGQ